MAIEWTSRDETEIQYWLSATRKVTMTEGERVLVHRLATPADLIAAIRAMPEGERETVLRSALPDGVWEQWTGQLGEIAAATSRAEKAERILSSGEFRGRKEVEQLEAERDAAVSRSQKAERERDEARGRVAELEAAAKPPAAQRSPCSDCGWPHGDGECPSRALDKPHPAPIDPERLALICAYLSAGDDFDSKLLACADQVLAILRGDK